MKRKPLAVVLLAVSLAVLVLALPAQAQLKLPRVSPAAKVTQTIGVTDLTVSFSRPGVKDRVIWGQLVPYDEVWRTGANEATTFTTTDSIRFGGKPLAPGTYGLYTLPGREKWAVIVNTDHGWGAFQYKPEADVFRVDVTPTTAEHQEWMGFTFENLTPNSADLVLRWEKLRVAVPVTVDVNGTALRGARAAVKDAKADDWRTPMQAAGFALTNDVALDEGRAWLAKSLAVQENYSNLALKARYQAKDGKTADAIKTAETALAMAKASPDKPDTAALEKRIADWKAAK